MPGATALKEFRNSSVQIWSRGASINDSVGEWLITVGEELAAMVGRNI